MIQKQTFKNIFTKCALILGLWLAISFLLFLFSGKIIYRTELSKGENYPFRFERSFVKNSAGNDIELIWVPAKRSETEGQKTILYLHGNAGRLPHIIDGLSEAGNVLSPAWPGFSMSGGSSDTENINETVDIAMDYLKGKGIMDKGVIIVGHSLGGSPAVYAAVNYPNVDRVVLVNTFLSIEEMCKFKYYIFCVFSGNIHNTERIAPFARAKIRQFHDKGDNIVPFPQGRRLFDLIGSPDKKFFELSGSHADFNVQDILRE